MSNMEQLVMDPRAIEWLREGPDAAPSGLLERSLRVSGQSRQRPYLLAVALGAPDARAAYRPAPQMARWLLVAALVLAAVIAVILASGTRRPDLLIVGPSARPPASVDGLRSGAPFPTQTIADTGLGLSVTSNPLEPWTSVENGWFGFATQSTRDFHYAACPDRACPAGVISISVAPLATGAIVDMEPGGEPTCPPDMGGDALGCATWAAINQADGGRPRLPSPATITGRSMDELLANWTAQFGSAPELRLINGVQWAITERGPRLVAFVLDGDRVVAVTAQPTGGPAARSNQERRLQLFLPGIEFDNPPAPWPTLDTRPVTTSWLDLEVTTPHWNVRVDGSHLFLQADSYGGLFGPQGFDIDTAPLGTEFVVDLGMRTGSDGQLTARISGATFDDVIQSIEEEIVAGSTPVETSVDGHRLVWWATPQHSYVGPLAWIAVLDAGTDVYLFQEHYPLDAPFQRDHVTTLLDGLRFVGKDAG